ncbi:MAG: hypothetical protein HYZ84_03915 [Candidatus Omnitrophica bacterium]|nr:hypothetical protein [Candidatus Omnitrophota bacterium]
MKVVNAFVHLFTIFTFLTLGSLLIIVALHILSVEDAVLKIHELYSSPWKSIQTGMIGLLLIMVGLAFSKILVKQGREAEALIFQSEIGPMVVSVTAIDDVVKKVLKRYHLVKESKIKTLIHGRDVEIKMRLTLWAGGRVADLLMEIQNEVKSRVSKLLGPENKLEVTCDVHRIEDHENELGGTEFFHESASAR